MVSSRRRAIAHRHRTWPSRVHALSLRPPLLFALDPETAHDMAFAGLDARRSSASRSRSRPRALPDDRSRRWASRFRNRVGLAAGLDKNARAHRRPRDARLRLHRGRHRDAAPAAGQSHARACSACRRRTRSSTGSASTTTASTRSSPTCARARYRGVLGINIGKNFDTPNERAADDYLACLRAVYAHAHYVTVNISLAEHQGPARPAGRGRARRAAARAQARAARARADSTAGTCRSRSRSRRTSPTPPIAAIARLLVAARDRRRDRDQHDDRARRASTACRTPTKPAACPARRFERVRRRWFACWRRRSTARCRSSASAASLSGATRSEKIDAGATLVQIYTGLIYRGPASSPNARGAHQRRPGALLALAGWRHAAACLELPAKARRRRTPSRR